jgi:hypothetical protein
LSQGWDIKLEEKALHGLQDTEIKIYCKCTEIYKTIPGIERKNRCNGRKYFTTVADTTSLAVLRIFSIYCS